MKEVLEKFNYYLENKSLRKSESREKILEEIFKIHEHFHIQDLLDKLKKYKLISRATVFRTVQLLFEAGFILKTTDTHGHVHYEHTYGHKPHAHLVCLKCGKEIETICPLSEREKIKLCKKNKFLPVNQNFQIFGYCKDCKSNCKK